jgi:hypothetical protein
MIYNKKEVQTLLENINYLLNRNKPTLKTAFRNGFIYIEYVKDGKTIFNNALTTKSLYLQLYAFREGLFLKIDE